MSFLIAAGFVSLSVAILLLAAAIWRDDHRVDRREREQFEHAYDTYLLAETRERMREDQLL